MAEGGASLKVNDLLMEVNGEASRSQTSPGAKSDVDLVKLDEEVRKLKGFVTALRIS